MDFLVNFQNVFALSDTSLQQGSLLLALFLDFCTISPGGGSCFRTFLGFGAVSLDAVNASFSWLQVVKFRSFHLVSFIHFILQDVNDVHALYIYTLETEIYVEQAHSPKKDQIVVFICFFGTKTFAVQQELHRQNPQQQLGRSFVGTTAGRYTSFTLHLVFKTVFFVTKPCLVGGRQRSFAPSPTVCKGGGLSPT